MLTIIRTRPFRTFQRSVGRSTFYIIGLELIARGGTKPDDLKIKWTAPRDPRQEVSQVRLFIHAAMLVHVVDALDKYLKRISKDVWFDFSQQTCNVLRKSIKKNRDEDYSISERFSQLKAEIKIIGTEADGNDEINEKNP